MTVYTAPISTVLTLTAVDADDRFPGQFTAYVGTVEVGSRVFTFRITPGDLNTYRAPGFTAEIDGGHRALVWRTHLITVNLDTFLHHVVRDIEAEVAGLY